MGIKIGNIDASYYKIGSSDCTIYLGVTKLYPQDTPQSKNYFKFIARGSGTYTFYANGADSGNTLSYSLDSGETWTQLANGSPTPTVSAGDVVMWKGSNHTLGANGIGTFSATTNFDVAGNAMSLHFGDNFENQTSLSGKDYAFKNLFSGCSSVIDAENLELPATTLSNNCYQNMFRFAVNLTKVPKELPATTLANYCYTNMFYGCKSLTTAPELPATTLANYCYNNMFQSCTSLKTAPELPATTLASSCYYQMFNNCTSLKTAPELPATKLASSCYYQMFNGCTNLTTAPELPATTLASSCYRFMFGACTNLTTAPELPATTLVDYCYYRIFRGCTRLNSITCLATNISASNCIKDWVSGVAASGTFTKAASMTSWTTGANGIPSGWAVQDYNS